MAHLRAHVDERSAAAGGDHAAGDGLGDKERAFEVEVEDGVVIRERDVSDGFGG